MAAAVVLLAVVLGRAQEVQYYDQHYTRTSPFLQDGGPRRAYAFARNQHGKRIGIAGSGEIFFGQYGFYGANLDNYVQYIGVPGPDGAYRLATSCAQFRRRINAGDYDFLIVSQYTQDSELAPYWYPIYAWLKNRPGARTGRSPSRKSPPSPTTSSASRASSTRAARTAARACLRLTAPAESRNLDGPAPVAQWTERRPSKPWVAGSNPAGGICDNVRSRGCCN